MGYLTFKDFSEINRKREDLFNTTTHSCAHWSLADWSNATFGEVGEAANIIKKIRRGDFSLAEKREDLAMELADIFIYLDILATKAGINLGEAIKTKFNITSKKWNALEDEFIIIADTRNEEI
jgi:NTP pyrophosphatase (non-canonical NTP hydrolase)